MGLLNSAIEEQKKAGLLNRTAGAEPVAPRRVVPATIQAPKQNAVQKVASKAYGLLPSVVRQGVDQVKDALFGNTRDRAVLQDAENKGQPVDFVTRLKVEGFLPFLGKSDEEVISENVVHLTDKGVAPERAEELAFYDRFKGRSMPGLPDEAKTRLDALAPTKDETRVLGIARLGNQLGVVGDAVGILPVGSIAKQGTRLTPRILVKATEETALKTLIKEGIDEGIATKFAPSVAAADAAGLPLAAGIRRRRRQPDGFDDDPLRRRQLRLGRHDLGHQRRRQPPRDPHQHDACAAVGRAARNHGVGRRDLALRAACGGIYLALCRGRLQRDALRRAGEGARGQRCGLAVDRARRDPRRDDRGLL